MPTSLIFLYATEKHELYHLTQWFYNKLTESTKDKQIIIAGDFNYPNFNWNTLTVERGAPDREVQQALIDFATEHNLTQVHQQPTRDDNILDLVFISNPSLVKISTSIPGISDHTMVIEMEEMFKEKML